MASLKFEFKNEARIIRAFRQAPTDFLGMVQKALEHTGGETVGKVKNVITSGTMMWKAPLDTGMMRGNISLSEKSPMKVTIAPNLTVTPYAKYVHEGTRFMTARPFLDITVETEQANIQSFFSRTINNFLNDLARRVSS